VYRDKIAKQTLGIVANAGGLLPGWHLKNVPPGY